jgi:hypothetical protein
MGRPTGERAVTLEEVARRFDATRSGAGFKAHCPAHEDRKESLSINRGNDQKIVMFCHAGCRTEDVLRAKGLTDADLFERRNGQHASSVATYDYRDLTGKVRYQKRRTADKQFFFARPNNNGGWITSPKQNGGQPVMQGIDRLLYRLDTLREQSEASGDAFRVYVAEGEKDVNRLIERGLAATTNDDGASEDGRKPKWKPALTRQLKAVGATEVVCLPDNDDAGRAHMLAVAQSCHAAGLAVRIVNLPDLPPKGDVSDFFDAGHTVADLLALADVTPCYAPAAIDAPTIAPRPVERAPLVTRPRTLTEVHEDFRQWLGDDYDLDAIDIVLAAAAAERLEGDPLWLLLISGPGNAKTETVQALSGIGAICVSTITSDGALLSASPKREQAKDATGGLLRSLGAHGILVIKDMTSILSMQSNTRVPMLSALREVHDGKWVRTVGTDGGKTLTWEGRVVVIGACTTAWDTHHSAISTMGDRFVLLRMNSHLGRESAGRHAIHNTGHEVEMRAALAEAVAGLLGTVDPQRAEPLTDDDINALLAAANITALCRTGVDYDYRGDPIGAHMPEMPTRLAKQLAQIIRGGVSLGMALPTAKRLAIRCAKDSMPPIRLAILEDLWAHPDSQLSEVRARLNMPWNTVKRQLDSLYLLQVLTCIELVTEQEQHVEVEEGGSTPKKKRTMKKHTTKRYRVIDTLHATALELEATDEPPF